MPAIQWSTGVYQWRNKVNGKVYVGGASVGFDERYDDYIKRLKKRKCHNIHLQRAWDKYGRHNFEFEILERCHPSKVDERETAWITKLDATNKDKGYNICAVANSFLGCKHTDETKAKISKARIGKPGNHSMPHTPETKAKMSATKKEKYKTEPGPRTGAILSKETKRKISESKRGSKASPETRAKMPETRRKISETKLRRRAEKKAAHQQERLRLLTERKKVIDEQE